MDARLGGRVGRGIAQQVGRSYEFRGGCRVIQQDKKSAAAILGQIEGCRKEPLRQAGMADGLMELVVLFRDIGQAPSPLQKMEHLDAAGENLDFAIGSEREANVAPVQSGQAMGAVAGGAWSGQASCARGAGEAFDIDEIDQHALVVY